MTPRQCEIAAESYSASVLALCGYDVSVQYGANQHHYDLIAVKENRIILVSVKGSQDGGWMLAVKYKEEGVSYHEAINSWLKNQRNDLVFFFVQYSGVQIDQAPRVYVARPTEIANHMKKQFDGKGGTQLQEDIRRDKPKSKYSHKIPPTWLFSKARLDSI